MMSRSLPSLVVLVVGAAVLLMARDAFRGAPDTAEADAAEHDASLDSARAERAIARADSAALRAVQAQQALADSIARWHVERVRLHATVRSETRHHAALADSVRARVDSATAELVDRMEAGFADAIAAEREYRRTVEGERDGYASRLRVALRETGALRVALGARTAETHDLRAANEALRAALAGKARRAWGERAVAVAAITLAVLR